MELNIRNIIMNIPIQILKEVFTNGMKFISVLIVEQYLNFKMVVFKLNNIYYKETVKIILFNKNLHFKFGSFKN